MFRGIRDDFDDTYWHRSAVSVLVASAVGSLFGTTWLAVELLSRIAHFLLQWLLMLLFPPSVALTMVHDPVFVQVVNRAEVRAIEETVEVVEIDTDMDDGFDTPDPWDFSDDALPEAPPPPARIEEVALYEPEPEPESRPMTGLLVGVGYGGMGVMTDAEASEPEEQVAMLLGTIGSANDDAVLMDTLSSGSALSDALADFEEPEEPQQAADLWVEEIAVKEVDDKPLPPEEVPAMRVELDSFEEGVEGGVVGGEVQEPIDFVAMKPAGVEGGVVGGEVGREPGGVVGGVLSSGGLTRDARLTKRGAVDYPKDMRDAGIEATCKAELTVDRAGFVRTVRILPGCAEGFHKAVEEAALDTRFAPARRDGDRVEDVVTQTFRFQLQD